MDPTDTPPETSGEEQEEYVKPIFTPRSRPLIQRGISALVYEHWDPAKDRGGESLPRGELIRALHAYIDETIESTLVYGMREGAAVAVRELNMELQAERWKARTDQTEQE